MKPRTRSGFTLMEIIVAIGVSALVGVVIVEFMSQSGKQYMQTIRKVEAQKDLMMFVKYLQHDLSHMKEYQKEDPRFFRREIENLFEVKGNMLSFATSRGEKITYSFDPSAFQVKRGIEALKIEELTIKDMILQKVQERVDKTFNMVTSEVQTQIKEKVEEFKSVFDIGDPQGVGGNPEALTRKCTEVFDKLSYYTGTDGSDSGFVTDLKNLVTGKAEKMASDIGYGVESDAEEVMGTVLTRYFQMEDLVPPKMTKPVSYEKTFQLKLSYRVIAAGGLEKSPDEAGNAGKREIMGFRFFIESPNPISTLEHFYKNNGLVFVPNALLLEAERKKSFWNDNPPARVKLKIMDMITRQEITSRYYGEAIIPDAVILYKTWVEIPEFWFLDIFNTEEAVEKLRKKVINPDDAEPKK